MRHSLQSHILYLENMIQGLKDRLTRPYLGTEEFEDLELQLATAESALKHYRHAFALELSVGGSEPPAQPGGRNHGGGADQAKGSKSEKKDPGLRGRKRARLRIPVFQVSSAEAHDRSSRARVGGV